MILRSKWTSMWSLLLILYFVSTEVDSYSIHDAPDYQSLISRDGITRYLYAIAFVDKTTASIYHNDPATIRRAVGITFTTASTYFYQLNFALILADVIIADRDFGQLSDTNEYHNRLRREHVLPYHDFAVFLVAGRYSGSSWPGQLCRPYNGVIVGMSPLNPEESGPIVFEQFAHLSNVSKSEDPSGLANCRCKAYYSRTRSSGRNLPSTISDKCLVVPGYGFNCTAQALYNQIKKAKCILAKIRTLDDDVSEGYTPDPAAQLRLNRISLCGNGIVEAGEHCDCGYKGSCRDHLGQKTCDQDRCRWHGTGLDEDDLVQEQDICECTLSRKILEQHCGNRRCSLNIPLWITHGVLYTLSSIVFLTCCCLLSCFLGRNPEKIYRQSVIIESRPKKPPPPPPAFMKPKLKQTMVTLARPVVAPPPPPTPKKPVTAPVLVKFPTQVTVNPLLSRAIPLPASAGAARNKKNENPYDKVPFYS